MKKQKIIFVFVFFMLAFLNTSIGQGYKRHNSQAKKITFYAKISDFNDWSGHVWVGFYDGRKEMAYGFYNGNFMVNGKIKNEAGRKWDIDYSFPVSDDQYEKGLGTLIEYKRLYILGKKDCRDLTASVAKAIGLTTPSRGLKSPAEWLAGLVDLN